MSNSIAESIMNMSALEEILNDIEEETTDSDDSVEILYKILNVGSNKVSYDDIEEMLEGCED